MVVLRFRTELRAPGCMHAVLEAVSPRAPYLLENRSGQGLRYRQAGIADLPYLPLPPYSAAGFAWQRDASSGGIPSVSETPPECLLRLRHVEHMGLESEERNRGSTGLANSLLVLGE